MRSICGYQTCLRRNLKSRILTRMSDNISRLCQSFGFPKRLGKNEAAECISEVIFSHDEEANRATDGKYISWLEVYPSALCVFQEIVDASDGKQIVVFLDYDGTLSPIVDDPNCAFMSEEIRSAVADVAKHFPTAIISGRSRDKVYEFVKLDEVYYAGSHGMDIMGPPLQSNTYGFNDIELAKDNNGNQVGLFQPARDFLPVLQKIMEELKARTRDMIGVFIEDNHFCLSVHYRHVHKDDYEAVEKAVMSVVEDFESFHLTKGKKVLEIRPSIMWNKGNALLYLLETLGFANPDVVLPIYIGDDQTDEDAFKALKDIGHGYPIVVSSAPRDTLATCSLRDPSEVQSFLTLLAKWADQTSQ